MFGWIQIEPSNIFQLFRELGIVTDLEAVNTMRLETIASPDTTYRRIGYAHLAGHGGARPMRSIDGFALRRFLDHLGDGLCWNRRSASWPWRILQQANNTSFEKALTPSIHGTWRYLHLFGYFEVLKPFGGQQNDTTAHDNAGRNRTPPCITFNLKTALFL